MVLNIDEISTPTDDAYFESHFVYAPARIQAYITRFSPNPRRILDFGCGLGLMSLAIARAFPQAEVIGVDIHEDFVEASRYARERLDADLPENLSFQRIVPGAPLEYLPRFDVIFSWSVMEHVSRTHLGPVLKDLAAHLEPQGLLFTQICPLYHSPFGSHLGNYVSEPWLHLLLSHDELRDRLGAAGVTSPAPESAPWMFGQHEMLNRITARELADLCAEAGLDLLSADLRQTEHQPPSALLHSFTREALMIEELTFAHRPGSGRIPPFGLQGGLMRALRRQMSRARRTILR